MTRPSVLIVDDEKGVQTSIRGILEDAGFDAEAVSQSMRSERETRIELSFAEGDAAIRFWTSDLTVDYVKINADYHT